MTLPGWRQKVLLLAIIPVPQVVIQVFREMKGYHKMCNSGQLGDEFHICLECPALKELRNKFLSANIYKRPNVINF